MTPNEVFGTFIGFVLLLFFAALRIDAWQKKHRKANPNYGKICGRCGQPYSKLCGYDFVAAQPADGGERRREMSTGEAIEVLKARIEEVRNAQKYFHNTLNLTIEDCDTFHPGPTEEQEMCQYFIDRRGALEARLQEVHRG